MRLRTRLAAATAATAMSLGGALAVATPAQAAAPCPTTVPTFYTVFAQGRSVTWVENGTLIASGATSCKYRGDLWAWAVGLTASYQGVTYFTRARA